MHLVVEIDALSERRDLRLSLLVKHIRVELNNLTLKFKRFWISLFKGTQLK
jgi:hypothetical protein